MLVNANLNKIKMKKLTTIVIKKSKIILLFIVVLTGLAIFSIKNNVAVETNLEKYMPETHPAFVYSDKAEELFDIRDGIIVAISIVTEYIIHKH